MVFRGELATTLVNRALRLADVGRHREADRVGRDAIALCEELAERNSDAYRHHLALSLMEWARTRSRVGPSPDAVSAAGRAADIYRRSAKRNPAPFLSVILLANSVVTGQATGRRAANRLVRV